MPEKSLKELKRLNKELLKACDRKQADLAEVTRLIDEGACVTYWSSWSGATPIQKALLRNHVEVARLLIDKGVNPNEEISFGRDGCYSPITVALWNNHTDMCTMLLEKGARPITDDLWQATVHKNKVAFAFLLNTELDFEKVVRDSTKNYVMYCAEKFRDPALVRLAEEKIANHAAQKRRAAENTPAAPPADPRDARIASLEAQVRALAQSLTSVQAELEDLKDPSPVLDKAKLPSPPPPPKR